MSSWLRISGGLSTNLLLHRAYQSSSAAGSRLHAPVGQNQHSCSSNGLQTLLSRPPYREVGIDVRSTLKSARRFAAPLSTEGTQLSSTPKHLLFSSFSSITLFSPSSHFHLTQTRQFGTTAAAMVATKLDGTAIAKSIRERLGEEITAKQKVNPRYKPTLNIIQGIYQLML